MIKPEEPPKLAHEIVMQGADRFKITNFSIPEEEESKGKPVFIEEIDGVKIYGGGIKGI